MISRHSLKDLDSTDVRQVQVENQSVDPTVPEHLRGAFLECLGRLALELAGVSDEILQPVVGLQSLRGRLRPDPGNARQVVAGLPHQRGELFLTAAQSFFA